MPPSSDSHLQDDDSSNRSDSKEIVRVEKTRPRKSKTSKGKWYSPPIYIFFNNFFRLLWMMYLGLRGTGSSKVPKQGAALLCCNHQSHLDPILVANCCSRYVTFVARESLFKSRWFGWLITALGAFPINRDVGLGGIKATLKRLKSGELVLIFPEGTRTPDGEIKTFKPGFCAMARKAKVPIVPVAIAGAYDAWPKSAKAPRPRQVRVKFGEPITPELIARLSDKELTEQVQSTVKRLQEEMMLGLS